MVESLASPWRHDFPQLLENPQLHYLDSAATALKPSAVVEASRRVLSEDYGPIHRGLYPAAERATDAYEAARSTLHRFLGGREDDCLVFTRSATESLNLLAEGWLQSVLVPGDEVWVTTLEHHANYLPWKRVCERVGATLRVVPLNTDQTIDATQFDDLHPRVKLVAITAVSNVLGVALPVSEIAARAHAVGALVVVDAAQAIGHQRIDLATWGCDAVVASAHKMSGPTGIGVLLARRSVLECTEPLLVGGGMVDLATAEQPVWAALPSKLEAGSPNLVGAVAMAAAADYLSDAGIDRVESHVAALTHSASEALAQLRGVSVLALDAPERDHGIVSFNLDGVHPHDVGQIAGELGVAVRAGHHCCQPLMQALGVDATVRASFALYNDDTDVDALVSAVENVIDVFGVR